MKKINRIIFVQLPLINHAHDYIQGNVEYGPGAIAGYIKRNVNSDIDIIILPYILSHFSSDAVISQYVLDLEPDLAGFTCFLWNIERNLRIAEMIKEKNRDIAIVFGGPEINFGSISFAHQREYVDYFVIGEGEWFFNRMLSDKDMARYELFENGNRIIVQPHNELIPASDIVEPFTGKELSPMPDGSMFFELTRGCPYRCSYCLYSKNYRSIRNIPFELLITALTDDDLTAGLNNIYILSPALDATKDFIEKLDTLARIRHNIRLHSEMRGEGINAEKAQLLYAAGFRSMEVGLQTLNRDSLKITGRMSNPEKELNGIRFLKEAGIEVSIGIIPGLPQDSCEQFIDMIDKLARMGFKESIELYPLMILPGTRIRDAALEQGINYNKKPPYYYNYGWGISFDEIIDITRYAEDATGYSLAMRKLPDFTDSEEGVYIRGVYFNGDDLRNWNISIYKDLAETNVFSLFIYLKDSKILYSGLTKLLPDLPENELFNIIILSDIFIEEEPLSEIISFIYNDHLIQRMNIFHDWRDGLKVRLYQVFSNYDGYRQAKVVYSIIEPIIALGEATISRTPLICEDDNILITKGAFQLYKDTITSLFSDTPGCVAFEDEAEQEEFYKMIGYEYTKLPFQFRIVKM
ncbi:MAG: hypothetical protein A2W19_11945 [Spirochaetes bacterium RBG_16_49_21]|nr:MAG: hypothetical protein A2W19_11945 [Spirochaetes bacterium RBG_16_49_21]